MNKIEKMTMAFEKNIVVINGEIAETTIIRKRKNNHSQNPIVELTYHSDCGEVEMAFTEENLYNAKRIENDDGTVSHFVIADVDGFSGNIVKFVTDTCIDPEKTY